MNQRTTKFIPNIKHALDIKSMRTMRDAVNSLLNAQVVGGQVHYSDGNVVYDMSGLGAGAIKFFTLVSDGGDYYNCNGGVKVAKHQDIRCILPTASPAGGAWPSKVIRGVTYAYTYTPVAGVTTDGVNVVEYVRGVTGSDSSSETDLITPPLNVGDIITAFKTSFSKPATLVGVTWQALADGRAWAAQL